MAAAIPDIPGGLEFRRQFFLGHEGIHADRGWKSHRLRDSILSWHPDLEVHIFETQERRLALLGFWVDPWHVDLDSGQILRRLARDTNTFDEVLAGTWPLAGRWALLYEDERTTRIFHDPCGLRQVHYAHVGGQIVCASQPALIRTLHTLLPVRDAAWQRLVTSPAFPRHESALFSDQTGYENCRRLLPNHALDLVTGEVTRYFPSGTLTPEAAEKVAEKAKVMLEGAIVGMVERGADLMLAVTAGWDSRVLLASSRPVRERIHYYVNRKQLSTRHPDIRIPSRLTRHLGLEFRVNETDIDLPDGFKESFRASVTGARILPKTHSIYFHFLHNPGRVNINGNGSEICRGYYRKAAARYRGTRWTGSDLASIAGYPGDDFTTQELSKWLEGLGTVADGTIDVLDLLYWELRMGHWGAQYPAEQDIAIEEFSPFNNRALLTMLLSVPESERSAPDFRLYQRIIGLAWPECLAEPINPRPLSKRIRSAIRSTLPTGTAARIHAFLHRQRA